VNQGASAGRDDDDLPLVDVVVPDDARELFRDVLAYRREQRAARQRARLRRIIGPLSRRGPILPLASGILLFALIAGVVLSVLSAGSYFSGGNGTAISGAVAPGADRLPRASISVSGRMIALDTVTGAALTLVPANCGCRDLMVRLITQARQAKVPLYLIAPAGQPTMLASLASLARLASKVGPVPIIAAEDQANALTDAFRPAGLTVLLVNSAGAVTVRRRIGGGVRLEPALAALRGS